MIIALLLGLLATQAFTHDSMSARAESLLAAGDVSAALKLATKNVYRHPHVAAAHFLLGRVHYARAVIGRYRALEEFKKAASLDPTDPAALYWQMKVGFFLRSDEGDVIAREALLQLFAVTPDYLDAWQRFQDVYRNPKIWRRAERALARHGEQPTALEHRAELLIDLDDGRGADSLLAVVAGSKPSSVVYLLRTAAAFLRGQKRAALAWHDSALTRADADSTDALWSEAWLIATPSEVARHAVTPPDGRHAFYERFWSERDPDLLTPENERLAEHYARLAEGRRMYRLLHPQRSIYHSQAARDLANYEAPQDRGAILHFGNLEDTGGLTAEGLVFVRHGKPDRLAACIPDLLRTSKPEFGCISYLDNESWLYFTPQGPLSIRFRHGGEFLAPASREQLGDARVLLATDRSSMPAPFAARVWSAVFRSAELGLTDVYYRTSGDSAAAVLWDTAGLITPMRASGSGLLLLSVPPGLYHLGLDVDSAGVRGRARRDIRIGSFSAVDLSLSSLVLAPSTVLLDREAALRSMPVDFVYRAGQPLASYVEIYGLTTDRGGRSRYRLQYSFAPAQSLVGRLFSNARPIVFEFDRESEAATAWERLIIEPDRLPSGRYRVTVAVTDLTRNVKSESVTLDIVIH